VFRPAFSVFDLGSILTILSFHSMEKVRVGIVGLGRPGLFHAYSVIQSGEGVVEGVCDINDARRNLFAENFAEIFKFSPNSVRH
jgi:predicted dehydrogenase